MDEMWSFVGSKLQKVWIWLTQDEDMREIMGCAMGDRSGAVAFLAAGLSPVRLYPYRFLGGLCLFLAS